MHEPESVEVIRGTVAEVTYQNAETGFTVLTLEDGDQTITAVGIMPDVAAGEILEAGGVFDSHALYGRQFRVSSYGKTFPSDAAAILRYLSSGTIKGIGPATAKRIVAAFGDDTFETLLHHPEEVAKIKGITWARAGEIADEMKKRTSMQDALRYFAAYGFKTEEILRIYGTLHENAMTQVQENPYLMCAPSVGLSFARADEFASALNFAPDFEGRIRAGILYVLQHNLNNGHTCLPEEKLIPTVSSFLSLDSSAVTEQIAALTADGTLLSSEVSGQRCLFLPEYFEAEEFIASRLRLAAMPEEVFPVSDAEIAMIEREAGLTFEPQQREAIKAAGTTGVMIVSGGPGTGKTTLLNAVLEVFRNRDYRVAFAAPTGRAAKRITEVTGCEAKNLHRLLEVERRADGEHIFVHNEKNPLDCDVLIVDEMSMVDTLLFASVLKALPLECRIILVGDHNQLPSVGAGNLLQDLISSGVFSCVMLTTVFRQSLESRIVVTAHKIREGQAIGSDDNGVDFYFIPVTNPVAASRYIVDLCTRRLPEAYGYTLMNGLQVLCPSHRMNLGVDSLGCALQNAVNPAEKGKKEIAFRGFVIREGDKVMQTKNNYDIIWKKNGGEYGTGVFNGDIGYVMSIDRMEKSITVMFDDREATYRGEEIFQLELAYAVTVHKSQGSGATRSLVKS